MTLRKISRTWYAVSLCEDLRVFNAGFSYRLLKLSMTFPRDYHSVRTKSPLTSLPFPNISLDRFEDGKFRTHFHTAPSFTLPSPRLWKFTKWAPGHRQVRILFIFVKLYVPRSFRYVQFYLDLSRRYPCCITSRAKVRLYKIPTPPLTARYGFSVVLCRFFYFFLINGFAV